MTLFQDQYILIQKQRQCHQQVRHSCSPSSSHHHKPMLKTQHWEICWVVYYEQLVTWCHTFINSCWAPLPWQQLSSPPLGHIMSSQCSDSLTWPPGPPQESKGKGESCPGANSGQTFNTFTGRTRAKNTKHQDWHKMHVSVFKRPP